MTARMTAVRPSSVPSVKRPKDRSLSAPAKARLLAIGIAIAALLTFIQPETLGGFAARRLDHTIATLLLIAIAVVASIAAACPSRHFAGFIWGLLVGCLVVNAAAALVLAYAPLGAIAYVYAAILIARAAGEVPK